MSVYSTQFFLGAMPANGTVIYTVPTGYTVVVRDIELYNGSAGPGGCSVQIRVSGALEAVIFLAPDMGANTWAQWQGRAVLNVGQELASGAGASGFLGVVSGYLLES